MLRAEFLETVMMKTPMATVVSNDASEEVRRHVPQGYTKASSDSADSSFYTAPPSPTDTMVGSESQRPMLQRQRSHFSNESAPDMEVKWYGYPPPLELIHLPLETSMEIETILEPSVERVQDRLVEEERLRDERRILERKRNLQSEQEVSVPRMRDQKGKERMITPEAHNKTYEVRTALFLTLLSPDLLTESFCPRFVPQ